MVPVSEDTASHTLLGVLLTLRHVLPHLSMSTDQPDALSDSFGAKTKQQQVTISTQQLVQVGAGKTQGAILGCAADSGAA